MGKTTDRRTVKKIEALSAAGVSTSDIANITNTPLSTTRRYISKLASRKDLLNEYKELRADSYTALNLSAAEKLQHLLDSLTTEEIDSLTIRERGNLALQLAKIQSFKYAEERLETGQSTQNIALEGILRLDLNVEELAREKAKMIKV